MLQERILQTLEKAQNIDQRKLSQIAHVNESSISRYLHGHEEINFEGVLRIVKFLYPEQEREMMAAYIPTQKSKNARYALEYCVMNNLWGLVKHLIDMLSASTNPVDKEWAAMYSLLLLRRDKQINPMEQLERIEIFKPRELEMRVLKSIFKAYIYYELEERCGIFLHVEGTDDFIKSIRSTFIRDSFSIRLGLIMSYIYLYEDDVENSREYSLAILKQPFFNNIKATAHYNLGLSFLLESYNQSFDYLNKALDYFMYHENKSMVDQISRLISFLKSYWDINYEFSLTLNNQRNHLTYVYNLLKKGEMSLANEHLKQIPVQDLSVWDKAHYYYYEGLLTDNKTAFYRSVEAFLYLNDYFHLKLPLLELKRLGEDAVALRILSSKRRK